MSPILPTPLPSCPAWCTGASHADDAGSDHFHDGAPHRIELDGRELIVYPTSATCDGEAFGVGVVIELRRGGRDDGDGDVLDVDQVDELVEALQRMREQVSQA